MRQTEPDRRSFAASLVCTAGLGAAALLRGGAAEAREDTGHRPVLSADRFRAYIDHLNANDEELYTGAFPNAQAWDMLKHNIPLLERPDKDIERVYYFRWWTYRKHIKMTPDGYVITEFLPKVGWAGKYNTISCAAALHYYEGRWLHNRSFLATFRHPGLVPGSTGRQAQGIELQATRSRLGGPRNESGVTIKCRMSIGPRPSSNRTCRPALRQS